MATQGPLCHRAHWQKEVWSHMGRAVTLLKIFAALGVLGNLPVHTDISSLFSRGETQR